MNAQIACAPCERPRHEFNLPECCRPAVCLRRPRRRFRAGLGAAVLHAGGQRVGVPAPAKAYTTCKLPTAFGMCV